MVTVYCHLEETSKFKRSITDILRKEKKWSHIKCLIEIKKAEKEWEIKRTSTTNIKQLHKLDIYLNTSITPLNVNGINKKDRGVFLIQIKNNYVASRNRI